MTTRQILVRLGAGRLPDALLGTLRDEVVLAGWLRGTAIFSDVTLRTLGTSRRLTGPLQAVVLDASLGFANGDVTCALRGVFSRETDAGLETIAGEIVEGTIQSLEALVVALDDVDGRGPPVNAPAPVPVPPPAPLAAQPAQSWADAAVAAAQPPVAPPPPAPPSPPPPPVAPAAPKPSPTFSSPGGPLPMKPFKPVRAEEEEQPTPEPGDIVEHFAFGRCEVVKSDGDRLHVRLGKDGRIKEIALEMLRVTTLAPVEGATGNHYRLDRKM
jgi:hypothetical protein